MAGAALGRRYAAAYFELALAQGRVDAWRADLARAVETLTNPEVATALANPRLPMSDRVRLALNLLDGSSVEVRNLARLLIERRRSAIASDLLSEFDRLADQARGVVAVEVTSAVELEPPVRAQIEARLRDQVAGTPRSSFSVDPALIGGLVIRIGDRVIDGSVKTHLQQLQASLA